MSAAQIESPEAAEIDRVLQWRFEVLVRAGYDPNDAEAVARDRGVDLHLAARLVGQGCPSRTAARIML